MAMNPEHRDYTSPSRLQRLESRRRRETVDERFTGTLEQLDLIRRAGNPTQHEDPMDHVDRMRLLSETIFSKIPAEFQQKKPKNQLKIESRVKAELGNGTFDDAIKDRPSTGRMSVVNREDPPLRLSFEALRIRGQIHKPEITSSYAGLFSQNAAINPNVEQGPVPDLYTARGGNKREQLEERRKKMKEEGIIVDRNRKARILEPHKLNLLGKKVDQEFIPTACVLNVGSRRQEVEQKRDAMNHAACSHKAFRI